MTPARRSLILVISMALLAGCQRVLVPTPNLYVDMAEDPFADVPPELQGSVVDVLYVTDREAKAKKDGSLAYTHGRSMAMVFGSALVEFGNGMPWDDLVTASRVEKRRAGVPLRVRSFEKIGRFPRTPPSLQVTDEGLVVESDEYVAKWDEAVATLHAELARRLAMTPRKDVFVYVHGIKNTMEDSAIRTAELWHFLGREGVPVAYSWPGGGKGLIQGYTHDRESSEFTIYHLKSFLVALVTSPDIERVHVIAHSRGTDVVMTALLQLVLQYASEDDHGGLDKVGQLVLAAPDIDIGVIQQRSSDRLFQAYEHVTIYVTPNDRALGTAEWLFATKGRMGKLRPEQLNDRTLQRMATYRDADVIDARVKMDYLAHSYFLDNPAVSSDLILTLRYGRRPADEERPLTEIAPNWYIVNDRYPREAAPLPKALRKD